MNSTRDPVLSNVRPCVYHPWVPLVSRVLSVTGRSSEIREAFPLFFCLCVLAHPKNGRVLIHKVLLAKAFNAEPETMDTWLRHLESRELIKVSSPGEFLVVFIHSWPGKTS